MTNFPFNAVRATQAAAWLVSKAGGKMSHIKLSKLLYIADREALRRWSRPIIGGNYASMEHGPVISPVVDCLKKPEERGDQEAWDPFLRREGNSIVLLNDPGRGQLHEAAVKLLDEIFAQCSRLTKWEVRDRTHQFPEYSNAGKSSKPIDIEDLLRAVDKSDDEVEAFAADSKHLRQVTRLIGC
jgi:uncharacterized phage-associated protein